LLTKIAAAIGWDQLLKIRSDVFVMEEEYRVERQQTTKPSHSHNASTVALHPPPSPNTATASDAETDEDHTGEANGTENGNGNSEPLEPSIEKPEQTVASETVKSGNEDVSRVESSRWEMLLTSTAAGSFSCRLRSIPEQTIVRAMVG
jgi:hypothetical protein